jgi:hypothetical protein
MIMITNHTVSLPASGYADAMTRLAALQAREGNEVNPVCKP